MAMAMALSAPGIKCAAGARVLNLTRGRLQLRKTFSKVLLSPASSRVQCSVETETQVQTLWSWAQAQGIQGEAVRPSEVAEGLGLLAQRPVGQGDEILNVPESVWINVATVQKSPIGQVCQGLKSWVAIALFLIHESSNLNSKWRPYLDTLPKTLNSPLFWTDEELAELQGTQLLGSVVGYLDFLENDYNKLMEEVLGRNAKLFNPEVYTFDAFRWAFGILRSRSFAPLTGDDLALVPVADLVNHGKNLGDGAKSWLKKATGQFWNMGKDSSNVLTVRASANFNSGEQILMQYGSTKSNADLALDYGFVERNAESQFSGGIERDSLALSLEISPEDRFVDDKSDILEINGFQCSMQFDLPRGQGPSDEMITFLRLSALSGPDSFLLEALFRNEAWGHASLPISRDNEEAICISMLEGLKAALDGYSTSVEEDMELLGQGDLSTRKEIAVIVRLGEKRVMQELQTWFEARLEELDTLEYYAERRLRNLGLMDDATKDLCTEVTRNFSVGGMPNLDEWRSKQDEECRGDRKSSNRSSRQLCSSLAAPTSSWGVKVWIVCCYKIVDEREQCGVASEEAEEERARARRRLRAEQDAEYQAALLQDQERDNRRRQKAVRGAQKKREEEEAAAAAAKKEIALDDRRRQKTAVLETEPEPGPRVTRVRVRLPNGEQRERMFLNTSTVQVVYDYVDTLMCFDVLSYSLLSSFPRVVYGSGSRDMTLKAAGFHPRISLFVQVDDDQ